MLLAMSSHQVKEKLGTRNTSNCELNEKYKRKLNTIKCLIFKYKAEKDKVILSPPNILNLGNNFYINKTINTTKLLFMLTIEGKFFL